MQYWLAVVGLKEQADDFETRLWWCLPKYAEVKDKVLIYCPRSVGFDSRQGIFAMCEVKTLPDMKSENNYRCSGFGRCKSGKSPGLFYVELKFIRRFKARLTPKAMKADPVIGDVGFVRKNFQGTAFKIEEPIYKRIIGIIEELEANIEKTNTTKPTRVRRSSKREA